MPSRFLTVASDGGRRVGRRPRAAEARAHPTTRQDSTRQVRGSRPRASEAVARDAREGRRDARELTIEGHPTPIAARPSAPPAHDTTINAIEPRFASGGATIEPVGIPCDAQASIRAPRGGAMAACAATFESQATVITAQVERSGALVRAMDARRTTGDARGTASASRGLGCASRRLTCASREVIDLCHLVLRAAPFGTRASNSGRCATQEPLSGAIVIPGASQGTPGVSQHVSGASIVATRASIVETWVSLGAFREGGRGGSSVAGHALGVATRAPSVNRHNLRVDRRALGVASRDLAVAGRDLDVASRDLGIDRQAERRSRARFSSFGCATGGSGRSLNRAETHARIETCRSGGAR